MQRAIVPLALLGLIWVSVHALSSAARPPAPPETQEKERPQDDFMARAAEVSRIYGEQIDRNSALLREGRVDAANRRLLDLVPATRRTAAHDFVLGNLLFRLDFEVSRRLHRRAHDLRPDVPLVVLEWGLQQHRSGAWKEAAELYREYLARVPDSALKALLADCLLRLGKIDEAVAAWNEAAPVQNHTRIEQAAFWVHGTVHPATRRGRLLAAIRSGKTELLEELIELDLHWDTDWWNVTVDSGSLHHDLGLAGGLLGIESPRYRLLVLASEHCGRQDELRDLERILGELEREEEVPSPRDREARRTNRFKQDLEEAGLLGAKPRLPESSRLANLVLDRMVEEKIVTVEWILQQFEKALMTRATSKEGDLHAAKILAACYQETRNPDLEKINRIGWERYRNPDFAGSLLASRGEKLRSDDELLVEVIDAFPDDIRLQMLSLDCARREGKPLRDPLARALRAELTHLVSADRAHALFRELELQLDR